MGEICVRERRAVERRVAQRREACAQAAHNHREAEMLLALAEEDRAIVLQLIASLLRPGRGETRH